MRVNLEDNTKTYLTKEIETFSSMSVRTFLLEEYSFISSIVNEDDLFRQKTIQYMHFHSKIYSCMF